MPITLASIPIKEQLLLYGSCVDVARIELQFL